MLALFAGETLRTEPSHNVHVDKCELNYLDWSCRYQTELNQRHYSAIMFLNDDFTGGQFFFAYRGNHTAQLTVQPKCGRLVAFSSGQENPHGVKAVLQGRRCVLAFGTRWTNDTRSYPTTRQGNWSNPY
ncbi:prolyl 3-hydroxylase 3-like [Branchiostoma floridae]|uniref:Prolyl 3-hydroxylase 3-like n=1 Tax=Branchiostoma floridae TaxID=7739 RepID=A0A9J7HTZ4_BRAFL|nr:prolyl 3-hydroxylase 3-like [Branchiostoma floridae]